MMNIYRKKIDHDNLIVVVDDMFSCEDLREAYLAVASSKYRLWFVDDESAKDKYKFLQAHYQVPDFASSHLGKRLIELLKDETKTNCVLERVFSMCLRYGDVDYLHKDYYKKNKGLSLVFYPNNEWEPDWGGETFFEISDSIYRSLSVKPGRIIIFDGSIKHRAGVPSRLCPVAKLSLNLRFNINENVFYR